MKTTRIVALVLCLVLLTGLMTACGKKVPQTVGGFTQIMENAGFEIHDDSDNEAHKVSTTTLFAVGENYRIEYYAYEDSDSARRVYENNYERLDEENDSKRLSATVNTNSYNYLAFSTSDDFYVIARIENTMVFCAADPEYRQEILDHIEALGYK